MLQEEIEARCELVKRYLKQARSNKDASKGRDKDCLNKIVLGIFKNNFFIISMAFSDEFRD